MSLTTEKSVVRQLAEMKQKLDFWKKLKVETKDSRLQGKCDEEIFKERNRIKQTTRALITYRDEK